MTTPTQPHTRIDNPPPRTHHTTPDTHPTSDDRHLLTALFTAGLVTFAQIYAPQAALPHIAHDLHIPPGHTATIISAGTLGFAAGVIPWVHTHTRLGWRRSLTTALITGTTLNTLSILAPTLTVLLITRFTAGIALAAIPALALARTHNHLTAQNATQGAGVLVAGNAIGGVLGRLLTGVLAIHTTWQIGMLAVTLLSAAGTLVFLRHAPADDTTPNSSRTEHATLGSSRTAHTPPGSSRVPRSHATHPWVTALRSRAVRRLCTQGFLIMGVFVTVYSFVGFRLTQSPLHVSPTLVVWAFGLFALGGPVSLAASHRAARQGRVLVVAGASVLTACGLALTLIPHVAAVLTGLTLLTVGFFAGQSILTGWVQAAVPDARHHAAALYTIAYYAGGATIGWVAGILYTHEGWVGVIVVTALCTVTGFLLSLTMRHH